MARFEARILVDGQVRVLHLPAADAAEARAAVAHRGRVISIRRESGFGLFAATLSRSERYILMIRLAAMIESRVGVAEALRRLGETFRGRVRRVTQELADAIEIGGDLPGAFERLPGAFPAPVVALVRAGCVSGNTPRALREAAAFEQEISEIEGGFSFGLLAALFNFFLSALVMVGTTQYLVPLLSNTELLRSHASAVDSGAMMAFANGASILVLSLATVLILMIAIATIGRRLAPVTCDRLIACFPVYRPIAQGRDTYIILYKLSLLIRSGVAVDAALALVGDSAPPGAMRRDLANARIEVKAGRSWPEALKLLPAVDRSSLAAAEDRTEAARTLNALALQYKDLYTHGLSVVAPVIKTISVVFLGIAGMVLFSLTVLPMFQVTSFISGQ